MKVVVVVLAMIVLAGCSSGSAMAREEVPVTAPPSVDERPAWEYPAQFVYNSRVPEITPAYMPIDVSDVLGCPNGCVVVGRKAEETGQILVSRGMIIYPGDDVWICIDDDKGLRPEEIDQGLGRHCTKLDYSQ